MSESSGSFLFDPNFPDPALSIPVVTSVSTVLPHDPAGPRLPRVEPPPASGPALVRAPERPAPAKPPPVVVRVRRAAPAVPDRDLVDRARQGDARAFGEFVRRHQQRIHRLALHMLRDRAEAEDITQEAFVRAYGALARFDGRCEPYTWLYRIAVNLSLNAIRARKSARRSAAPLAEDGRHDGSVAQPAPQASAPPVDAARRQLYDALASAIDTLSETLRTTLILVCVDGRAHDEAAAILGAPEGTIGWRVHEARRKLREVLAARGFDLDEALAEVVPR